MSGPRPGPTVGSTKPSGNIRPHSRTIRSWFLAGVYGSAGRVEARHSTEGALTPPSPGPTGSSRQRLWEHLREGLTLAPAGEAEVGFGSQTDRRMRALQALRSLSATSPTICAALLPRKSTTVLLLRSKPRVLPRRLRKYGRRRDWSGASIERAQSLQRRVRPRRPLSRSR